MLLGFAVSQSRFSHTGRLRGGLELLSGAPCRCPDSSPPRLPLTAAAPPGGRLRPQQRAVNLLQPLQVALSARAWLSGHLLHGCHHGVEIALQGGAGAGLPRKSIRARALAHHSPSPAPRSPQVHRQPGGISPLPRTPAGASPGKLLLPTSRNPLLPDASCSWGVSSAPHFLLWADSWRPGTQGGRDDTQAHPPRNATKHLDHVLPGCKLQEGGSFVCFVYSCIPNPYDICWHSRCSIHYLLHIS